MQKALPSRSPRHHACLLFLAGLVLWGVMAGAAQAAVTTLGSVSQPAGSTPYPCGTETVVGQYMSDPSGFSYSVPPGGGQITSWQTNVAGATAGGPVELVVMAQAGADFAVVGVDPEAIPTPLPASGVESFTIERPINVTGGEFLGVYTNSSAAGSVTCFWHPSSSTTATALGLFDPADPGVGQVLPVSNGGNLFVNVAAQLVSGYDASVAAAVSPSRVSPGQYAVLSATVANAGPAGGPLTFTDHVPAGLSVISALAGAGGCTVSGQVVSCNLGFVAAGQSVPLSIIVSPTTPGSDTNIATVVPPATDAADNPDNNSASATLAVVSPTPPNSPAPLHCVVPKLGAVPRAVATRVLSLLGCRTKVLRAHSKKIAKGLVISTSPRAGTYADRRTIKVTISSGRPPKKHKKK